MCDKHASTFARSIAALQVLRVTKWFVDASKTFAYPSVLLAKGRAVCCPAGSCLGILPPRSGSPSLTLSLESNQVHTPQ